MESKAPILKQAWDRFYASLEAGRQAIEDTPRFDNPAHRAQAYGALLEAQAMAYNWVVAPRLNHPRIFTHTVFAPQLYAVGAPCPDFIYGMLPLDGRYTYRVRGRHGDVRLLVMQVYNKPMGTAGFRCTGNYEFSKSKSGNDTIDIVLSASEPKENAENWISLDPASDFNVIYLRRLLLDWDEDPGELEVDMVGELEGYDELSESALARRIEMAAEFNLAHAVRSWAIGAFDFFLNMMDGRYNVWASIPAELLESFASSLSNSIAILLYDIKPDEAIIIEIDVPVGSAYWSFQLLDVWSKALDYMHAQTDLNMKNAVIDADSKLRVVISLSDPGVANWLDPTGRRQGICFWRNYCSQSFPEPVARLVNINELYQHLPAGSRVVSAAERSAATGRRRPAILRLYGG